MPNIGTPSPSSMYPWGLALCNLVHIIQRVGLGKGQHPPYPRKDGAHTHPPPYPSIPTHHPFDCMQELPWGESESFQNNGGIRNVTVSSQNAAVAPLLSLAWGWEVVVRDLLCSLCSSSEFLCAVNPDFISSS